MDAADRRTIRLLQIDGRISNTRIAKAIGISEAGARMPGAGSGSTPSLHSVCFRFFADTITKTRSDRIRGREYGYC
ncbi:MAG: AsnC family transcriptional regulator [Deltaproteobacteria bacterium]|nr:AsnC family transcriptional regulator [Deltaproteobacteria bacterium]MBW2042821.1 AsnC family transcriptional regulator [Deltaproteobacteria bacterium]MBW2133098.1 AsnC family transcriptional regulator [Deltaproteobacteria bacterium]